MSYVESREIIYGMHNDTPTFDGADILKQLKSAVEAGRKNGNYDKTDIMLRKLNEIQKIEVFDIMGGEEVSAFQFLEENEKERNEKAGGRKTKRKMMRKRVSLKRYI